MNKGKLIVIEGACDGIGKTTQYNMLYNHLQNDNQEIINHHFPSYNTYQGLPVEKYLKGEYGTPNNLFPYFINSLYAIDRAITWTTELKPQLDQGKTILLDRYTTSSLIYQSALIEDIKKRKEFIDYVCDFEYNKLGIRQPDNIIFLSAPFELVTEIRQKRKQNDGIAEDIHESNIEFLRKVYTNSIFVADYLSWNKIECNIGNNLRTKEDIHEEIYRLVKKKK